VRSTRKITHANAIAQQYIASHCDKPKWYLVGLEVFLAHAVEPLVERLRGEDVLECRFVLSLLLLAKVVEIRVHSRARADITQLLDALEMRLLSLCER